jgi:importin-9
LKALVNRDFAGISKVNLNGRSGLDYLLEFIGKMLGPDQSESAAIFVGPLLTKFIQRGQDLIIPLIPQLLKAVIVRLSTAKMPAFIETLVLVFCHIIQKQCSTVIDFLDSLRLDDNTSGLILFFSCWCDVFNDFQGVYQVKLSTTTLMMVLSLADDRLNSILVKGDLIVQKDKKIKTRSMAKNSILCLDYRSGSV